MKTPEFHAQQAGTGQPPDLSTWLSRDEAAQEAQCSTRTIKREAARGHLQSATWRSPDGGQERTVYHPGDVARLAARLASERQRGPLPPFVVPGTDVASNGNGRQALAVQSSGGRSSSQDLIRGLATLLLAVSEKGGTDRTAVSPLSPVSNDPYLTVEEAAAYRRVTPTFVRKRLRQGVPSIRDRCLRLLKSDADRL
jgi:hypothetical protein